MSETALGLLMDEVTAQPPADVQFDAIADRVHRRQSRLRASAVVTAVATIVLAVTVPFLITRGSSGTPAAQPSTSGQTTAASHSGWTQHSRDGLSWQLPPSWSVVTMRPITHSTPGGLPSTVVLISDGKISRSCGDPDKGMGCIGMAMPAGHLIGTLSMTSINFGQRQFAQNPGTVSTPGDQCDGLAAAKQFTEVRDFGTSPVDQSVQLVACLGKGADASLVTTLRQVMATLTDDNPIRVDASWHDLTVGPFTLHVPGAWSTPGHGTAGAVVVDGSCLDAKGETPSDCNPAPDHVSPGGGQVWPLVRAGSAFAGLSQEQLEQEDGACRAAGGFWMDTPNFRHIGPRESGEQVALAGCFGRSAAQQAGDLLTLVLATAIDSRYGDPKALCSKVAGRLVSADLSSVGDIRQLRWGDTRPAAQLFKDAPADDVAAWCWVRDDASQQFVVWAAHAGDPPAQLVTLTTAMYRGGAAPSGLPMSPPPASLAPAGSVNHTSADALCTAVSGYSSSWPTTVGELRKATWGTNPSTAPLAHVFPGVADGDNAAWCWASSGSTWTGYVVHAGSAPVDAIDVDNVPVGFVPAGPPLFPHVVTQATAPPRGETPADALCKAALPDYLTATLTTVADVRAATWGPPTGNGKGRLADAFPGAKGTDPAAWCWDGAKGEYDDYAVHAGQKVKAIGVVQDVSLPVPSGPPNVP